MKYLDELRSIASNNGGLLRPADVVAYAADPSTALHSRFTWDDTEAASHWRLHQARQLIRVSVTLMPQAKSECKAFVSLKSDRYAGSGGGYRSIEAVVSAEDHRAELLQNALDELLVFQKKYRQLRELSAVFDAVDAVIEATSVVSVA